MLYALGLGVRVSFHFSHVTLVNSSLNKTINIFLKPSTERKELQNVLFSFIRAVFPMSTHSLPPTLKTNWRWVHYTISLSKINCPFTPLLPLPSVSIHSAFGSRAGTFQNDLFGPRFLDIRRQETQKQKSQNGLSPQFFLSSQPPPRVFVIPCWAKQTCVY